MKRVLIIQLARFGDLVQSKRLILSLRHCGAEVHLLVDRSLAELAKIVYPCAIVHCIRAHAGNRDPVRAYVSARDVIPRLRSVRFDRIYNLNFSGLNFALASCFPLERVRGYRYSNGQHLVDPWPALAMRWSRRRRETSLNLTDFWAGYAPEMMPPDRVNPLPKARGDSLGVVMSGRNQRRSLPPDLLAPLVRALCAKQSASRIVLLGAAGEQPLARRFLSNLPPSLARNTTDLTGKTGWRDLVEELARVRLLVSPDTGTMHLAAHAGVPVSAFFLSSAWCFETGPYGEGHLVFQAWPDCAPCLETQSCSRNMLCLEPFRRKDFLRFLLQDDAHGMRNLGVVPFRSTLDSLGVDFLCGTEQDRERQAFRALLLEKMTGSFESTKGVHEAAEALYRERDWMLHPEGGD